MTEKKDSKFTDLDPIVIDSQPLKAWHKGIEQEGWEGEAFDLVCCDCGLTHNTAVMRNTKTNVMQVLMSRDNRSTAQYRRYGNSHLQQNKDANWEIVRKDIPCRQGNADS